jgi:hypothetical protein
MVRTSPTRGTRRVGTAMTASATQMAGRMPTRTASGPATARPVVLVGASLAPDQESHRYLPPILGVVGTRLP